MKYLIINADDFGYSKIFNIEILKLIKSGLISSTTVMVNWITDAQDEQVKDLIKLTQSHNVSVGLHLEFKNKDYKVSIEKQFEKFTSIFGFEPSHVDIHKSSQLQDSFSSVAEFCRVRNLPARNNMDTHDIKTTLNRARNGTKMNVGELKQWIENLTDNESYEIVFHPGTYDPESKSSLNKERENDVLKIKEINPLLKQHHIQLISFFDLTTAL